MDRDTQHNLQQLAKSHNKLAEMTLGLTALVAVMAKEDSPSERVLMAMCREVSFGAFGLSSSSVEAEALKILRLAQKP